MRKTGEERRREIIAAAVAVISERGYYGATLQEIADRAEISQAGLIKYVKNKEHLLDMVLHNYDESEASAYLDQKARATPEELAQAPALMPEYYRITAREVVARPQQTRLYSLLRAEGINAVHPAHAFYADRGPRMRAVIGRIPWKLPPEYQTPRQIECLTMCVGSAMDGLELRWFGEPDIDFLAMWSIYEDILFPLPHWEGYR